MNFYAFKPDTKGNSPVGTAGNYLFELKTVEGGRMRAKRIFGEEKFVLFSYRDFCDSSSFVLVFNNTGHSDSLLTEIQKQYGK